MTARLFLGIDDTGSMAFVAPAELPNGGGPHDHDYAPDDHTHPGGDHPDLATHTGLGLAVAHTHPYASDTHDHDADYSAAVHTHVHNHDGSYAAPSHSHLDADIPAAIARDAEVTAAIATHAATPHGVEGGGPAFPVGSVFLSVVSTNPATLLGYGTWSQVAQGLFLAGQTGGQAGGDQIGSATHSHGFTQPADHAALTHSGATVGNHAFTQPGAHTDHAALSHSAHAGATVGNHTDVLNHVHAEFRNSATTGGLDGWAAGDTSTTTPLQTGYTTGNPTSGGVAAQVHTVGQANAHTDHAAQSHSAHSGGAVDAHTVGQANQHAAQSHASGAVADGTVTPPGFVVYVWERTA